MMNQVKPIGLNGKRRIYSMSKLPKYPPRKSSAFNKMVKAAIEWSQRPEVKAMMVLYLNKEIEFYESILSLNTTKEGG